MHYKKIIREYLNFNRAERRAIFVLILISILAIVIPSILAKFKNDKQPSTAKLEAVKILLAKSDSLKIYNENNDDIIDENNLFYFNPNTATINDWLALGVNETVAERIVNYISKGGKYYQQSDLLKTYGFTEKDLERLYPYIVFENIDQNKFVKNNSADKINVLENTISISPFNPNTISKEQWVELGVKEYVAGRIINYISKGGKYKSPEDLLKTYGFEQKDYKRLKDYMIFEEIVISETEQINQNNATAEKQITEINAATKDQLIALGFSNYNANGVITYRESLGGYYVLDQLKDVYKMDLQILDAALPYIKIDNSKIQKININAASFEQLAKHAYISDAVAQAIIDYRNTSGKFIVISELQKIKGMYANTFEKLKPYLTI
ncbi:MAG: helix-hairpin-helix domain-containing protein [Fimbriimonadaceae bacterium]|nr:helix-hairpin-helix domain-containing protein [Chitinophagales bacterium]